MVYNPDSLDHNERILKGMICGFLKTACIQLSLSLSLSFPSIIKNVFRGGFMARGGKFIIKGEAKSREV
jgi:hypothetical protein